MKKGLVILLLVMVPLIISENTFADDSSGKALVNYIKELDPNLVADVSSHDDGFSFTMDTSQYGKSYQDNIHEFFWNSVQIINWIDNKIEQFPNRNLYFYVKKSTEVYGFTLTEFNSRYDFITNEIILKKSDSCTAFEALFEHAYRAVYGGYDMHNYFNYLLYDALKSQVYAYSFPYDFQKGVFWAYSSFDKNCEVDYSERYLRVKLYVGEDDLKNGIYARLKYDSAAIYYPHFSDSVPESMPFESIEFRYYLKGCSSPILTCTIQSSENMRHPEIESNDGQFADGFGKS